MSNNPTIQPQPVSKVVSGYSNSETQEMFENYSYATALIGGDVSLYTSTHMASFLHTAIVPPRKNYTPLPLELNPDIGKVMAETAYGTMSLDEFITSPKSRIQAFIIEHKGKVIYECYPGMKPADCHVWYSSAKPITALAIEQLIDEGKIDQNKTYGEYLADFRGTAWEHIKIIDILNMGSGLNIAENDVTRSDPTSLMSRLFHSTLGAPDPVTKKLETTRTIMKLATKDIEPGKRFDYSSMNTLALVILATEVSQMRFSDLVDEKIFSHMALRRGIQFHLSRADQLELGNGFVSSSLRDMMHFGMLYTPSWKKVSDKQVVSDAALHRIRKDLQSHEFFTSGYDGPNFLAALKDYVISNNRQWDDIFPDGDMFKLGFNGQGLYVSPDRDLVIAYFSTNPDEAPTQAYMRPLAKSGIFNH